MTRLEMSGKQAVAGGVGVMIVAIALFVGGGQFFQTQDDGPSDTTDDIEYDGYIEQIGLADADLEDPFAEDNDFTNIAVDSSANSQDKLTDAYFNYTVNNGTNMAFEERTAVAWHEVSSGAIGGVDYTLESGANHSDNVDDVTEASVYNYESAEDSGELGQPVAELDYDSDDGTAELDDEITTVNEGEYAVYVTYKFSDTATTPAEGEQWELNNLAVDADDGDSDEALEVSSVPFILESN